MFGWVENDVGFGFVQVVVEEFGDVVFVLVDCIDDFGDMFDYGWWQLCGCVDGWLFWIVVEVVFVCVVQVVVFCEVVQELGVQFVDGWGLEVD